jgi:hypothetical protein
VATSEWKMGPSQAKQRAQAKARKRMTVIVASFQQYVSSYDKQSGYADYLDKTLIHDMLYGLGRAMDEKAHTGAEGYEAFRGALQKHLKDASGMGLAEPCFRLPDGSRIEQTKEPKGSELWAVFKEGRVLHVDGSWQWAKVPTDEEYLRTCRYPSAKAAYDAWSVACLGRVDGEKMSKPKRSKAA